MATAKLTALQVDRAHRRGKPILLGDGEGLYYRQQSVKAKGAAWTFRYRFATREHWLKLGNYPDMTLAEARAEARQARVLLDKQQNPIALRRDARDEQRRRGTFSELGERWYQAEVTARGLKHPEVPRRYLDKYLVREFGRQSPADITATDVARLLDRVKIKAPTAANDLLRLTRRIFAFGVRRHIVKGNPAADFSPRLDAGGTERARSRALTRDELTDLFAAIRKTPSFGGDNLLAVKLLLATCVRKGELLAACWEEFDLDGNTDAGPVWRVPAARTKTETGLNIPLVPAVVDWLKALKQLSTNEFVFPKRRRDRRQRVPHMGIDTLNVAMQRVEHELEPFTLHDLRRTARTHLAQLGVRREVAERCLGHALRGVEGTYNKHDYFDERRAALGQWTTLLQAAERGERKVTAIGNRKRA